MKENEVVTVALINGAEVIGLFVSETNDEITINQPKLVQINEQGMGLSDGICITGEELEANFTFRKNSLLFSIKTSDIVANAYNKHISKIVTPDSKIIL